MRQPKILERNRILADEYNSGTTLAELSTKYDFEMPYLRSILKENGVVFKRKERYSRSDQENLKKRDLAIVKKYNDDVHPSDLAKQYNLTKTRVIQILKDHEAFVPKTVQYDEIQKIADSIRADIKAGVPYESVYQKTKFCENKICKRYKKNVPQAIYKCQGCGHKLTGKKNKLLITGILDKYGKEQILACKKVHINIFREAFDHRIHGVLRGLKNNKSPLELSKKFYCTRDYIYYIKNQYGNLQIEEPETPETSK